MSGNVRPRPKLGNEHSVNELTLVDRPGVNILTLAEVVRGMGS